MKIFSWTGSRRNAATGRLGILERTRQPSKNKACFELHHSSQLQAYCDVIRSCCRWKDNFQVSEKKNFWKKIVSNRSDIFSLLFGSRFLLWNLYKRCVGICAVMAAACWRGLVVRECLYFYRNITVSVTKSSFSKWQLIDFRLSTCPLKATLGETFLFFALGFAANRWYEVSFFRKSFIAFSWLELWWLETVTNWNIISITKLVKN